MWDFAKGSTIKIAQSVTAVGTQTPKNQRRRTNCSLHRRHQHEEWLDQMERPRKEPFIIHSQEMERWAAGSLGTAFLLASSPTQPRLASPSQGYQWACCNTYIWNMTSSSENILSKVRQVKQSVKEQLSILQTGFSWPRGINRSPGSTSLQVMNRSSEHIAPLPHRKQICLQPWNN